MEPVEPGGGSLLAITLLGDQLSGSLWPEQSWHPWLIDPCKQVSQEQAVGLPFPGLGRAVGM